MRLSLLRDEAARVLDVQREGPVSPAVVDLLLLDVTPENDDSPHIVGRRTLIKSQLTYQIGSS